MLMVRYFFLSKTYYKSQRMSDYQCLAIECLPEVVVEKKKKKKKKKKKSFHLNHLIGVVKTKVESGQTQVRMPWLCLCKRSVTNGR